MWSQNVDTNKKISILGHCGKKTFSCEQWLENFCISNETFDDLVTSLSASDVGNDFVACRHLWTTSIVFGTCSLGSLEKNTMHTFLGTCHCFRKVCKDSFSPGETNKWCRWSNTFNKATAFPLLPWLMKPFTDNGHLNAEEVHFNDTPSQDAKSTLELFVEEKFMPALLVRAVHCTTYVSSNVPFRMRIV